MSPLDPSIITRLQAPQVQSPFEALSQVAQLQGIREQTEARRLAAEEARTKRTRQQQIDQAFEAAVKTDPETGEITLDENVLFRGVPGSLHPELRKQLAQDKESVLNLRTATLNLEKAKVQHLGSAAQTVIASGGDPTIWGVELKGAHRMKLIDDETYTQLSARTDPKDILAVAQSFVQRAGIKPPELEKITTVDAQGREVTQFVEPKPGAIYPTAPPKAPTPAYQQKDVLLDGRPAIVTFDSHTGQSFLGGQDVTGRVRPIPPQGPGPEPIVSIMGPDGKPIYVTRSQALGKTPGSAAEGGGVKLSAAQQDDLATMLTVQDLGTAALELGDRIKWRGTGPVAGRAGEMGARWFGAGGEDAERLRNLVGNIQGTIAKLRGGTAFSAQEQVMLERYTPTTTDSVLQIKAKLKSLDEFITAKRENTLRVASGQYTPRERPTSETGTTTPGTGPKLGERRMINGQLAEWKTINGQSGWAPVR